MQVDDSHSLSQARRNESQINEIMAMQQSVGTGKKNRLAKGAEGTEEAGFAAA